VGIQNKMFFKRENNIIKVDKNKKTLIFDFDGTIADTFEQLLDILDQYSGDFGVELADKRMLEELRSMSAVDIFKKFRIPFFLIPFINNKVKKNLGEKIKNTNPFKDVIDAIKILKKEYNIGIVTSNAASSVNIFLHKEKIENLFDFVYSEKNMFGKHKTLNKLIEQNNLDRKSIIYLGDEARDVEACVKANVTIISVGWGFNSEKLLKKVNPNNYVETAKEMIVKIHQIFKDS